MFHAFSLVVGLSIPALMHAPRMLRAPPLLALTALFIVNDSYLEHLYVLEATGEPIPTCHLELHAFFCAVLLILALTPDVEPVCVKPHNE